MMAGINLSSGSRHSFSHTQRLATAAPTRSATSRCRSPKSSLRLRIWSPKVLSSFGYAQLLGFEPTSLNGNKATNECPCGYLGDSRHECRCTPTQIQRYRARISGPLLDRIDLHVEAPALSLTELRAEKPGEPSAPMRERVQAARSQQHRRFAETKITSNARMTHAQIRKHCAIDSTLGDLLQQAMEQLHLSARAYDRILKVARTIADLAAAENIAAPHLLEAIQYRSLDRTVFY